MAEQQVATDPVKFETAESQLGIIKEELKEQTAMEREHDDTGDTGDVAMEFNDKAHPQVQSAEPSFEDVNSGDGNALNINAEMSNRLNGGNMMNTDVNPLETGLNVGDIEMLSNDLNNPMQGLNMGINTPGMNPQGLNTPGMAPMTPGMGAMNSLLNNVVPEKRMVHPLKVSFYEFIVRQLLDDNCQEEAMCLKQRFGIRENTEVENNYLYKMYENNYGRQPDTNLAWTSMNLTPIPALELNEKYLDIDEPRFDLNGSDKITYSDSYKQVVGDEDPESIAKGEGKGLKDDKTKEGEVKARPLHRKKANIFNKVHFNTPHKQMVRAVAFSPDGRFAATGSHDTTVKVLDTHKMMQHTDRSESRPVIRTLYDHTSAVNAVAFHPTLAYLFSGGADKTVKVFDLTKPATQLKALSSIPDSSPIQTLALHPSGDYLYVGTVHPVIRMYDLTTLQCYSSINSNDHHIGNIQDLDCSSDGKVLVSASSDGDVKLWDTVGNKVVNSMTRGHMGSSVNSAKFSRSLKYLLTSGCDGKARLWDIRKNTKEPLFTMSVCSTRNLEYARASFVGQERFIAVASSGNDLCIIDAQTGEYLQGAVARGHYHHQFNQHSNPVFCIAPHPCDTKFLTGSDDHKVRYCEILNRPEDWLHYRDRSKEVKDDNLIKPPAGNDVVMTY